MADDLRDPTDAALNWLEDNLGENEREMWAAVDSLETDGCERWLIGFWLAGCAEARGAKTRSAAQIQSLSRKLITASNTLGEIASSLLGLSRSQTGVAVDADGKWADVRITLLQTAEVMESYGEHLARQRIHGRRQYLRDAAILEIQRYVHDHSNRDGDQKWHDDDLQVLVNRVLGRGGTGQGEEVDVRQLRLRHRPQLRVQRGEGA